MRHPSQQKSRVLNLESLKNKINNSNTLLTLRLGEEVATERAAEFERPLIPDEPLIKEPLATEAIKGGAKKIARLNKTRVNINTWHRRFAHLGINNVVKAAKVTKGLDI